MTRECDTPRDREEALAGLIDGRWEIRLRSLHWLHAAADRDSMDAIVPLTRDPKRQVRQFATVIVGLPVKNQPFRDAVPLLMERVLQDTSPRVRRLAVQMLAFAYAHPDLTGFFQQLLDSEKDPKLHKLAGIGLYLSREAGQ